MLRNKSKKETEKIEVFQSLFWWIMVAKTTNGKLSNLGDKSFNPCSGGLWLLRFIRFSPKSIYKLSFNPCSGGLWLLSI